LKALQTEINRLESSKVKEHSFEKLNTEHKKLIDNYKKLQIQYKELQEEISNLKKLIPESKSNNGLFGRFLKRNPTDEDKSDDDTIDDETKK